MFCSLGIPYKEKKLYHACGVSEIQMKAVSEIFKRNFYFLLYLCGFGLELFACDKTLVLKVGEERDCCSPVGLVGLMEERDRSPAG